MELCEDANPNTGGKTRRSTRVETDVLIEVRGDRFAYAGEAVTVSPHGALIRTSALLELGSLVTVHVHRTGKSASAHVVSAMREPASCYGIELDSPLNIWGMASTPEDWMPR
jgi:PilZ domain